MMNYSKIIVLLIILWNGTIVLPLAAEDNSVYYEIKKGDGFYNLGKRFKVTPQELIRLNPQLKEGLKNGQRIRIPVVVEMETPSTTKIHSVEKGQTLYSIAKMYGLTTQELIEMNPGLSPQDLQPGRELVVEHSSSLLHKKKSTPVAEAQSITPSVPAASVVPPPSSSPSYLHAITRKYLKAALLLPFNMSSSAPDDVENRNRFLDYYRGILLAVDSLKMLGRNIELTVIDTRNNLSVIDSLITNNALREMDFVIGPAFSEQAIFLAPHLASRNIPMVIPFSSKMELAIKGLTSYQVNPPAHLLNARAVRLVKRLIPEGSNVIFISNARYKGDKAEFAEQLRSEFAAAGVRYKQYKYTLDTIASLKKWINPDVKNFIITETSNVKELSSLLPNIQTIKAVNPLYDISLVGYPEWQTYFSQLSEPFFALNTYIFTPFYAETDNPAVKAINKKYTLLFRQFPLPTYPHYALLGFDTGFFFFNSAHKSFTINASQEGLQTIFEFVPSQNKQYVNNKVFIVNFGSNMEVIRQ